MSIACIILQLIIDIIKKFTDKGVKIKKQKFWLMADTACVGLVLGQIIGRWGNFFNREAFGGYTNGLFAMQLPLNAVRSPMSRRR